MNQISFGFLILMLKPLVAPAEAFDQNDFSEDYVEDAAVIALPIQESELESSEGSLEESYEQVFLEDAETLDMDEYTTLGEISRKTGLSISEIKEAIETKELDVKTQ